MRHNTCMLHTNRRRAGIAIGLGLALLFVATSACQLGDGSCLRMSDCEPPYACVEGTCVSDQANDAVNATASDASKSEASSSSTSDAKASDASSTKADGSASDAASK